MGGRGDCLSGRKQWIRRVERQEKGFMGRVIGRRIKGKRTTTKPMIIHLAAIPFDIIILRFPFCDFEIFSRYDDVGGARAAGPFLAVEAVAAGKGVSVSVRVW